MFPTSYSPSARRRSLAALLACFLLLVQAGCQEPPAPDQAAVVRPVAMAEVGAAGSLAGLRFPGRVQAARRAELGFNVPGEVVEILVKEGDSVTAGDLLARLDPANYQASLNAARAEMEQARVDYDRVRTIWEESQAVARAEVDRKRTAYEVARARFAATKQDFDDTRLMAPFSGRITRRFVEPFTSVQPKEPVLSLQDLSDLEVVIHVPERVVRNAPRRAAGWAELEGQSDQPLPVSLRSFASEPDPQTQTYAVVLGLERVADVTILPGMSVTVYPDQPQGVGGDALSIPVAAVVAQSAEDTFVWVVAPDSGQVSRRPVRLGQIQGELALVSEGLQAGERVVTSGIQHLHEGMRVRPLDAP